MIDRSAEASTNPAGSLIIRPAFEAEQKEINTIIRLARLNPVGLDWRRFLVVVDGGEIVGVAQVKPHRDGTRELASIAVVPARQGQGIGSTMIHALLARETSPLYLFCESDTEDYYTRFGFRRIEPHAMPSYFRRMYRLGNLLLRIRAIFMKDGLRLVVMRQEQVSNPR